MYAVMTTGGKQYRVEAGSELVIERLTADAGASVTFDRVLLVGDGEAVTVGTPTVDGASVSGTVLREELGPKLIIFKFKQKVKYRRTAGHRQHLTRVRIDQISTPGKTSTVEHAEKPAKAEPAAASAPAETVEKPKRARRPAAKAAAKPDTTDATDEPKAKPATRRRSPAKKAESKE